MGVGPYGRTGRDQLAELEPRLARLRLGRREVVVFACAAAGWDRSRALRSAGVEIVGLSCAGSLHSSVVETCLRRGVGGVVVLACPARDCRYREGPKWTEQRLFHGREAELHERADRERLRFAALSQAEASSAVALVSELRDRLASFRPDAATGPPAEAVCDRAAVEEEVHA
jgi:coenzyme F420-reducing hydrogenase delta subunit